MRCICYFIHGMHLFEKGLKQIVWEEISESKMANWNIIYRKIIKLMEFELTVNMNQFNFRKLKKKVFFRGK